MYDLDINKRKVLKHPRLFRKDTVPLLLLSQVCCAKEAPGYQTQRKENQFCDSYRSG